MITASQELVIPQGVGSMGLGGGEKGKEWTEHDR